MDDPNIHGYDDMATAWKDYLRKYPYSTTEWRDTWDAFKWGWDAAMEIARRAMEDN